MVRVGIIGCSGHAAWHFHSLQKLGDVTEIVRFHPHSEVAETNTLSGILHCDAIVVSSPTPTHSHYISELKDYDYDGYIYLEKPGFTSQQEAELLLEYYNKNPRICIGYHLPYTSAFEDIMSLVKVYGGDVISVALCACTGLAYKKGFGHTWRAESSNTVAITGMTHFLSVIKALGLTELPDIFVRKSEKSGYSDTCFAVGIIDGVSVSATYSWGAPYEYSCRITLSDALIVLDDNRVCVRAPRDVFNSSGLFKRPRIRNAKVHRDFSPALLQHDFIGRVANKRDLSVKAFRDGVEIGRLCLKIKMA